jgi:hypothetical protein
MENVCPCCGVQIPTERISEGVILVPYHRSQNGKPYCGGRWLE